jgi:hypothetical protein
MFRPNPNVLGPVASMMYFARWRRPHPADLLCGVVVSLPNLISRSPAGLGAGRGRSPSGWTARRLYLLWR